MQLPGGLKKGETFLDISLDAYHWSVWMEHSGFNLPKVVDHFFVMTEDQMESFFKAVVICPTVGCRFLELFIRNSIT